MCWKFCDGCLCIISTYVYVLMATFSEQQIGVQYRYLEYGFETVFLLTMIKNFLTDYTPDGEIHETKNLLLIAKRYLSSSFPKDLIAQIPITIIFRGKHELVKLFYLLKILRTTRGIQIFDSNIFMATIQKFSQQRMERLIREDLKLGEDTLKDHNNFNTMIFISYGVKTLKLIILIFNVSFFIGMVWLIYCEISQDIILRWRTNLTLEEIGHNQFFLVEYELENYPSEHEAQDKSNFYKTITVMYYAFTSLSTLGFGDFIPQSDPERLLCAFILLFGVAIFSYIMGNFMDILDQFQKINEPLDEDHNLAKFICLLTQFNRGKPFDKKLAN